MVGSRRPSRQTVSVLRALADEPESWRYGYELCRQIGLKSGSLYPILMRLADSKLVESAWESNAPAGRPPRHLYRLSSAGLEAAAALAVAPNTQQQRHRASLRGAT
jgi:PadR family transcriptional regulator, regulatory protein PadR